MTAENEGAERLCACYTCHLIHFAASDKIYGSGHKRSGHLCYATSWVKQADLTSTLELYHTCILKLIDWNPTTTLDGPFRVYGSMEKSVLGCKSRKTNAKAKNVQKHVGFTPSKIPGAILAFWLPEVIGDLQRGRMVVLA